MKNIRSIFLLVLALALCGCAGGPTHDYYSPAIVDGPKFKGPITMALVDDLKAEKVKCVQDGYTIIGTTDYMGKYPEACELRAQAKRVNANHIIYSCERSKGQASVRFYAGPVAPWAPNPMADQFDVKIVFMGK